MRIFVEVPRGGVLNDSGVVEEPNFHRLLLAMFENFRQDIWDIGLRVYAAYTDLG